MVAQMAMVALVVIQAAALAVTVALAVIQAATQVAVALCPSLACSQ